MIELEKILKEYEQKSYQLQNPKQIKSGKEATVFVVSNRDETLALKVYIDPEHRSFKDTSNYLEGKYFRSSSQKRALIKGNKYGKKLLHKNWVRREFFLLQELHQLGANVPEVYALTEDSILMQFIGDETVAPQLISIDLTEKQAKDALESILEDIQIFLRFGIIHSDLSGFNILWWKDQPWIIDLPQAVDIRQNPNSMMLLKRDLENIINFFSKYFEVDREEIFERFNVQFKIHE